MEERKKVKSKSKGKAKKWGSAEERSGADLLLYRRGSCPFRVLGERKECRSKHSVALQVHGPVASPAP